MAEQKAQGITAVIDLRVVGEADFDGPAEEADVKKLGMKYFHIPVSGHAPKDEQADES